MMYRKQRNAERVRIRVKIALPSSAVQSVRSAMAMIIYARLTITSALLG
jgi:hypothetical protein